MQAFIKLGIRSILPLIAFTPLLPLHAEVTLSGALGSNMVIQRDRPATLWGWADAGEKVTVKLGSQVVAHAEGNGREKMWRVQLPPLKAGPVENITVSGKTNTIKLANLLAGDVWLCSGQSNMAMTVMNGPWCHHGSALNAEKEVADARHPEIRLYTVENNGVQQPQTEVKGTWAVCGPESLPSASATAYFFGRELQSRLNVPIGLVISALGGSSVEPWTPKEALENDADHAALVASAKKLQAEIGRQALEDRKLELEWRNQLAEAKAKKQPAPAAPAYRLTPAQRLAASSIRPILDEGSLYNGKIHPLTPMTLTGAIWYQGEANASRAEHYAHSLTKMIEGWRSSFKQPFPFLIVQLANFDTPVVSSAALGSFALVREAQEKVALTVPNCGIATAVDIGVASMIHPPNKQEVGRRLAQVALKQVYGRKVPCCGPRYAGVRFDGGKAIVRFAEGSGQLVLKGNGSFEIAGDDRKFIPAKATLKGGVIEVAAPSVPNPIAVRYAFLNAPEISLYNRDGWPALPFRSDSWEIPNEAPPSGSAPSMTHAETATAATKATTTTEATEKPTSSPIAPTQEQVPYGPLPAQNLDFWQAKSDKPTPLIMNIHGGGWLHGPKEPLGRDQRYLDQGISVAHITYRFTPANPLPAPVMDAARALQFLRSKAAEWNIDPNRVIVTGFSAGGCSALWLATHDDLANPDAADPVERQSTRVSGAMVVGAQSTIEPENVRDWVGEAAFKHPMISNAGGFKTNDEALKAIRENPAVAKLYHEFSPINHLSPDDPPILLEYGKLSPEKQGGIHGAEFGVEFKKRADALGIKQCWLRVDKDDKFTGYPGGPKPFVETIFNLKGTGR